MTEVDWTTEERLRPLARLQAEQVETILQAEATLELILDEIARQPSQPAKGIPVTILERDPAALAGLVGTVPPTPNNPRGIRIEHRGDGDHLDCAPNVATVCSICARIDVSCTVRRIELDAILEKRWLCADCRNARYAE